MAQKPSQTKEALGNFPHQPNEAGVRVRVAQALLNCSTATIWRLAKSGKLQTRKVSERVTVFTVGSIRALLAGGDHA
jgi:hypothetical protein